MRDGDVIVKIAHETCSSLGYSYVLFTIICLSFNVITRLGSSTGTEPNITSLYAYDEIIEALLKPSFNYL